MSKLTILSVAYPFAPVGPDAVGGAEQILTHVEKAIVDAGHRSIVVACEGSITAGELLPTPRVEGAIDESSKADIQAAHRANIDRALDRWHIDVIHMHGIDFDRYLPSGDVPALVTLHLPLDWYPADALRPARANTYLHSVSMSQYRTCPPGAAVLPAIENGVPVDELSSFRHARRDFALALGRVCPEKNFHMALDAGSKAGIPVFIGGEVFPYDAHQRYFEEEIIPRVDNKSGGALTSGMPPHRFLGPLGMERKRRLLSAARCLVSASVAPETSSLVAMEAMACGTPVVALASGALPEIVEHGRTGYLVNSLDEMAEAMQAAADLNHEMIRETARRRFSVGRMTSRYLAVYEHLARRDSDRHSFEDEVLVFEDVVGQ